MWWIVMRDVVFEIRKKPKEFYEMWYTKMWDGGKTNKCDNICACVQLWVMWNNCEKNECIPCDKFWIMNTIINDEFPGEWR